MSRKSRPRKNVNGQLSCSTMKNNLSKIEASKNAKNTVCLLVKDLCENKSKHDIRNIKRDVKTYAVDYWSDKHLELRSDDTVYEHPGDVYEICFGFNVKTLEDAAEDDVLHFLQMQQTGVIDVFLFDSFVPKSVNFNLFVYPNEKTLRNLYTIPFFQTVSFSFYFVNREKQCIFDHTDTLGSPDKSSHLFLIKDVYNNVYGKHAKYNTILNFIKAYESLENWTLRSEANLFRLNEDIPFGYELGRGSSTFDINDETKHTHGLCVREHLDIFSPVDYASEYQILAINEGVQIEAFNRLYNDYGGRFISCRLRQDGERRHFLCVRSMSGDMTGSYNYMDQRFYGKGALFEHTVYTEEMSDTYNRDKYNIPKEVLNRECRRVIYREDVKGMERDWFNNMVGSVSSYVFNFYVDADNRMLRFLHPVYIPYVDYHSRFVYDFGLRGASPEAIMIMLQCMYLYLLSCGSNIDKLNVNELAAVFATKFDQFTLFCKVDSILPTPMLCVVGIGLSGKQRGNECIGNFNRPYIDSKAVYPDTDVEGSAYYEWNRHFMGTKCVGFLEFACALASDDLFRLMKYAMDTDDRVLSVEDRHARDRFRVANEMSVLSDMASAFTDIFRSMRVGLLFLYEDNNIFTDPEYCKHCQEASASIKGTKTSDDSSCEESADSVVDDMSSDGSVMPEKKELTELGAVIFPNGFDIDFNDMFSYVRSRVIGHDDALRRACYYIWKYLCSLAYDEDIVRSNFILAGGSGCGKTEFLRSIRDYFSSKDLLQFVPVERIDVASLTAPGYKGINLDEAFANAINKSSVKNGVSVIFFDEFDKKLIVKNRGHDSFDNGVQYALLSVIEGSTGLAYQGPDRSPVSYDTRRTLFIGAGTFDSLRSDKEMESSSGIGFTSDSGAAVESYWSDLDKADLIKHGAKEELLGRFTDVINFRPLSDDALREILHKNVKELYVDRPSSLLRNVKVSSSGESELIEKGKGKRGVRDMISSLESTMNTCAVKIIMNNDINNVSSVTILGDDKCRVHKSKKKKLADL